MSFFKPAKMMKKRFKFQVTLFLEELCSVPFVTGSLHCKVRLRDGGNFTETTNWSDVQNHTVIWKKKFVFQCKMSANPATGILESCVLRISIRKESKGGKGAVKVGLVDLNLAEFAGSNHTTRHCLLEPYQEKNRLDNSLLKVIIGLHLLSGDPCFKIPTMRDVTLPLPEDVTSIDRREGSESSGFGSLSRKSQKPSTSQTNSNESGHSRNTSSASQHSKLSDSDFKNSSTPNSTSLTSSPGEREPRNISVRIDGVASPGRNLRNAPPPRPPPPRDGMRRPLDLAPDDRMGGTRVSADDIVDEIMADQDFNNSTTTEEDGGLRLYVASDGSTALGGQSFYNRGGNTMFQRVVIDPVQPVPRSTEAITNRS